MDLSRTVSEIYGDFRRKSTIFPSHPVYLTPPLKGFPLELGIGAWCQKSDGAAGPNKTFDDIFSHVDRIQCTNVTDGHTDRHRTTANTALYA